MTQLECAKNNIITPLLKKTASLESKTPEFILKGIREGTIVLPANNSHHVKKPCAIGKGLTTKINANIGTSTDKANIRQELNKLYASVRYGADTVMDLSVGGGLGLLRRKILSCSPIPVGTVPIYEIAVNAQNRKGNFLKFDIDDILGVLEQQAKEGVDFFTLHSGVTRSSIKGINKRVLGIVSRGGAILTSWIHCHKKENPFYEHFDKILDIAYRYDVTLSLGDGLRPGSILDATDRPQIAELKTLGRLRERARKRNVQVMIEGPGHIPINQIKKNIELEKKICRGAPFYVLGPLVTDIAAGYDHITSAIGGALAASLGADFLCYVTPAEHLRHPSIEDVREGIIASKIAAHAADIAKGSKTAILRDLKMSRCRKIRDWQGQIKLSIDPDKARRYRESSKPRFLDSCTMCGEYCSIKLMEKCLTN